METKNVRRGDTFGDTFGDTKKEEVDPQHTGFHEGLGARVP